MIQTHLQLISACNQYNSLFKENELCLLQKAYTTPHFLVLSIRFPGKTVIVFIGRGNQYQGLYLSDKLPPSHLRIQDRFLDYIRKNLVGKKLAPISIEKNKSIICFSYFSEGTSNTLYFGWKARSLYFSTEKFIGENDFEVKDEVISSRPLKSIEDYYQIKNFEACKKIVQKKKEKFLQKKILNIEKDINRNLNWKKIEQDVLAGNLDLSGDVLKIYDEQIKFQGAKNEWQKRDLIYKKIKKMKAGALLQTTRLGDVQRELTEARKGELKFEYVKEGAIQPVWPTKKVVSGDYRIKSFSIGETNGIIGLNAEANDYLRKISDKEFYWFHLDGHKGAHAIVKQKDLSKLNSTDLQALASMLRDYSKIEINSIPIVFTQVKNIKGVKGSAGMVLVKKGKHLNYNYIQWETIIKIDNDSVLK